MWVRPNQSQVSIIQPFCSLASRSSRQGGANTGESAFAQVEAKRFVLHVKELFDQDSSSDAHFSHFAALKSKEPIFIWFYELYEV